MDYNISIEGANQKYFENFSCSSVNILKKSIPPEFSNSISPIRGKMNREYGVRYGYTKIFPKFCPPWVAMFYCANFFALDAFKEAKHYQLVKYKCRHDEYTERKLTIVLSIVVLL